MNNKIIILIIAVIMGFTSDKPAYKLFNKDGKQVKYSKMIRALSKADVVFIGELHNSPISHWMELEITKDLAELNKNGLTLGAEMFEADNQLILNEYLDSLISKRKFEAEMRLWPNYKTDYKPLINIALKNKYKFIATNIPRRYASAVYKSGFEGLDKLSNEAKTYIAPLPITYDTTVNCYAEMLKEDENPDHFNPNIAKSQAVKDATMAYFIIKNLEKGKTFIHYNGAYHSDNYEGIVWYLKRERPDLKILTVSTVEQDTISSLKEEYNNKADFIFVVPENMTKTY
ncbi:MAG: ChaN family lipoprotein [Bacteroidales bacterium]|nr:ChaN family lipoprotein [Bacteroidales bacterium]